MKRFLSFLKVSPIAMAALAASLIPGAFAGDTHCSSQNLIMKGTYVVSGSGSSVGVGPVTSVGLFTYNGDGTGVSGMSTISINGTILTSSGADATYTVNPDCSGTKTIGSGPSAQHYNFVITPDGKTITWILTDPGRIVSGNAVRMGN